MTHVSRVCRPVGHISTDRATRRTTGAVRSRTSGRPAGRVAGGAGLKYPVWWWGYPQAQVQIYLYALPLAQRRKFHGISFSGRLVYPDGEIVIDPSINDDFIASGAQT